VTRTYCRAQFAAKLRRLANAIESAKPFTIRVGGDALRIPADATFNVDHERSGSNEELEFQTIARRQPHSISSP
jgi:amphi-Trp domain-containing protein